MQIEILLDAVYSSIQSGEIDFESFFNDILINGFKGFNNMTQNELINWVMDETAKK